MKINPDTAADVLKVFIQEDRTEARIYRDRMQNMSYTVAVASFAISAFLIGNLSHISIVQLRHVTLLIDLGLVAIMLIFFWRMKCDLIALRKSMRARQNLLNGLDEKENKDIDPFPDLKHQPHKPDIKDDDLFWVLGLSVIVVLIKMSVLTMGAASFAVAKGTP